MFCCAGYLIGKLAKGTVIAIVLLVFLCSIPSLLIFGALRSGPELSAQRVAILREFVLWDAVTTLLVLAGYVSSRRRSLGMTAACALLLMLLTSYGMRWLNQTNWLNSMRWHEIYGDRVQIGLWEFAIPDAWYGKPLDETVTDMWQGLGFSEMVSLERRSLSISREHATLDIFTPATTVTNSPEEAKTLKPDSHFQIQGESGMCSVTRYRSKELRFSERCIFPKADLRVAIKGRDEKDLDEAGLILSGGRLVTTSNPNATLLPY